MTSTVEQLGQITNLVHGFIYFAPEASTRYEALGLAGRQQYFAGRAAAMGPVDADMVAATFFNFNPDVVDAAIPSAWEVASPADVQQARFAAVADVLDRTCSDIETDHLARASEIAAAMVAGVSDEGKPLAAGNRAVELPTEPLLRLWQLVTVVREWRGDAHVNALREADVSGIEALVLHAATGQVPAPVLKATRAWSDEQWSAAVDVLASRGLVDTSGDFTATGERFRADIESRTNQGAQALVAAVGDDQATELYDLLRPIRKALLASGVFTKPLGGAS